MPLSFNRELLICISDLIADTPAVLIDPITETNGEEGKICFILWRERIIVLNTICIENQQSNQNTRLNNATT